jgi:hypothetical protein
MPLNKAFKMSMAPDSNPITTTKLLSSEGSKFKEKKKEEKYVVFIFLFHRQF